MDGKKLKELRRVVGIGQAELAKRVGVTQGMISQMEACARNCAPDTLESIARELKVNVAELVGPDAIPMLVRLIRNCRGLNQSQLVALNEVVLCFKKGG
jgi:transcriptional regulator with XRE-family HTH domain